MTKDVAIRLLKLMHQQAQCSNDDIALDMAISALQEKEPAPSANDTSSKEENLSKENDSTEKAKCQEEITVSKELSKDLFQLMFNYISNMVLTCTRHGLLDAEIIGRVIRATIVTIFLREEGKHDRH